jgi:hypothetical protein
MLGVYTEVPGVIALQFGVKDQPIGLQLRIGRSAYAKAGIHLIELAQEGGAQSGRGRRRGRCRRAGTARGQEQHQAEGKGLHLASSSIRRILRCTAPPYL